MKLQFLRYFVVLCEELHFGRAASKLAITQSPLSAAIKSLEEELGVKLLLRNSKMVQLTPAGAAYLVQARQILERVSSATSLVKAVDKGMIGRLDIGLGGSLIYREVLPIIDQFNREIPGIDIRLHELPVADQFERLLRGQLHAGFTNGLMVPPPLKSIALRDDVFVLYMPEGHPMADRAVVDLRELADERFILFPREIGPANHDNVLAIFSRAGVHPRIVHEARTWLTVMAMVSQGRGLAVLPSSMGKARMGGVRLVPFAGPPTVAPAMLAWNPTLVAPALATFVESAARAIAAQKTDSKI